MWSGFRPRNLDQRSGLREAPEGTSSVEADGTRLYRGHRAPSRPSSYGTLSLVQGDNPSLPMITTVPAYSVEIRRAFGPIRHARPVERFGIRGTIPLSRDARKGSRRGAARWPPPESAGPALEVPEGREGRDGEQLDSLAAPCCRG